MKKLFLAAVVAAAVSARGRGVSESRGFAPGQCETANGLLPQQLIGAPGGIETTICCSGPCHRRWNGFRGCCSSRGMCLASPAMTRYAGGPMNRLLLSMLVAVGLVAPAAAHHDTPGKSHAVATVTITETVKADGKPLAPGTYEIWILDDRPNVGAGAPSDAQRVVELHQNGKIVAREVAEVFSRAERPVGTSGTTGSRLSKAAVQTLRGGEFIRIAINDASGRYLIHLPTAAFSAPAPTPQAPSRVEVQPVIEVPQSKEPQQ